MNKTAWSNNPGRSFRLTCSEEEAGAVKELLTLEGFRFEPEPFSPSCQRLTQEPFPLGSSLASFFGLIYIQDRSSMLPPLALNPPPGAQVLDMCASPGSKTGFLAQLVGETGFVLANEPNPKRFGTLRANLERSSLLNVGLCSMPGEGLELAENSCTHILLDPPCSGWGTLAKNPGVTKIWRDEKIYPLTKLQRALLKKAANLLAPGGRLLYSTCTTNPAENEAQIAFAQELGLEKISLEPFPGFKFDNSLNAEGCLLVNGPESEAQGFFLALLKKPFGPDSGSRPTLSPPLSASHLLNRAALASPVCNPELLPKGEVVKFCKTIRFAPASAFGPQKKFFLPKLGELGSGFHLTPRMRKLLPQEGQARLVMENIAELKRLLNGQTVNTSLSGTEAGLWFQDLPLGKIGLKGGRAISLFR